MHIISTYDNGNEIDGTLGCPHVQMVRTIAHITEHEAALPEEQLIKLMTGSLAGVLTVSKGLTTNRLYAKVLQY